MTAQPHLTKLEPFLLLHRPGIRRDALAAFALALSLVLFRYRVFILGATHFLGGTTGDAGLYTWLFRTVPHDLLSLPWFTTRAFYPYGGTLAWSDNFILPAMIGAPFLQYGIPLAAAYNGVLLLAAFLAGFCTYRLAYMLFGMLLPAVAAGVLFMFDPFIASHLGHPQLQFTFWIPLTALLYFRFMARPSICRAACISLCLTGAFLSSVYYAVFGGLLLLILLGSFLLLRPTALGKRQIITLAGGLAAGFVPLLPFVRPYLLFGRVAGARAEHEAYFFAANALSYFAGTPLNALYSFSSDWSHAEALLFPGILLYALAGLAAARIFQLRRDRKMYRIFLLSILVAALPTIPFVSFPGWQYLSALGLWGMAIAFAVILFSMGKTERSLGCGYFSDRDIIACFAAVAIFAMVVSFGPLGYPEAGIASISPFAVLYDLLPGVNAIRAIGRIGILFHFALVVLAACALTRLARKTKTYYVILAIALALGETIATDYPLEPLPQSPPVFEDLARIAQPDEAVLILPMAVGIDRGGNVEHWSEFATLNTRYMNWAAMEQYIPTVNGYSGFRSKIMRYLPGRTLSFPDPRSLRAIREIAGVRYVIFIPSSLPSFNRQDFEASFQKAQGLEVVKVDSEGNYLFRVDAELELHPGVWLLAPSYQGAELPLRTRTQEQGDAEVTLRVYSSVSQKPIWEYRLPARAVSDVRLPLRQQQNAIAPLALRFETDAKAPMTIAPSAPVPSAATR